jgi:hypothetical protein
LEKEYLSILIFGQETFEARHLTIQKGTLKIAFYLLTFLLLSITFFFCDYIQIKKKVFELNRLDQETQVYRSHIRFFSGRIEDLEKELSKLKDFDRKIRVIANLEEKAHFIGIGGSLRSGAREDLKRKKDGVE